MTMGTTMRLTAARSTENGVYFSDGEAELLLPRSEVPEDLALGTSLELFVYRDSEDRPTATRRKPAFQLGQIAALTIVDNGSVGAFASWGLLKDLLIPKGEQLGPLVIGQQALVRLCLDPQTDRLYGTTKLAAGLSRDLSSFRVGQEVRLMIWKFHDQGWSVLVNENWQGLVYRNETSMALRPGQALPGWITQLRDDGKIDVRLRPQGFVLGNADAERRIEEALDKAGGRIRVWDGSSPAEIQELFGLSKKAFKTACGTLMRRGRISMESGSISTKKDESKG